MTTERIDPEHINGMIARAAALGIIEAETVFSPVQPGWNGEGKPPFVKFTGAQLRKGIEEYGSDPTDIGKFSPMGLAAADGATFAHDLIGAAEAADMRAKGHSWKFAPRHLRK